MKLSQSPVGKQWLAQFKQRERKIAVPMLDAIELVSMSDFEYGLTKLMTSLCASTEDNVAFYITREVERCDFIYDGEYKYGHFKYGVCRAIGEGPSPTDRQQKDRRQFDINAVLFKLLLAVQKDHNNLLINPGPDQVRMHKVRKFFLLTDFVGTGQTIRDYLYNMWKIPTLRSWHSSKYISVEVVAYAMTYKGRERIKRHCSQPQTHSVIKCPSLYDFTKNNNIKKDTFHLCSQYSFYQTKKYQNELDDATSYDEEDLPSRRASLIAFEYGFPDSVPRILRANTRQWNALFPTLKATKTRRKKLDLNYHQGVTPIAQKFESFPVEAEDLTASTVSESLLPALATFFEDEVGAQIHSTLQHLKKTRSLTRLSHLITVPKLDVKEILDQFGKIGLIEQNSFYLNDNGRAVLKMVDKHQKQMKNLSSDDKRYYYPSQLRVLADT